MSRVASLVTAAIVLVASISLPTTPAVAFLDFLFGRPPARPVAPPQAGSLDISVRPKKVEQAKRPPSARQHARREEPDRKPVLQQSIDPRQHPDWFLSDPTLRSGDIVVLGNGAFVYEGGRRGARLIEDYASLGASRTINRAQARHLRMMVTGIWTPPEPGMAAPARKKRRLKRR